MGLAHTILVDELSRAFATVRWVLEGIDDSDCYWEPATPSWSVRTRKDAGPGWGTGDWVCEDEWPQPDPLPITTIAWRLAHLSAWTDVYHDWTFTEDRPTLAGFEVPEGRDGLVAWLCAAQDRFAETVADLDEPQLTALRPVHWGPDFPVHQLISVITTEHVHHGAEIALLGDLRRGRARIQPPPTTA